MAFLMRVTRPYQGLQWAVMIVVLIGNLAASVAHAAPILYGAAGVAVSDSLLVIDPATGAVSSTIGSIGFSVTGMAMDPTSGILYGVTAALDPSTPGTTQLITINPSTGAGNLVGALGNDARVSDIAFSPSGVLYGVGTTPQSFGTINVTTGLFSPIAPLPFSLRGGGVTIDGLGDIRYSRVASSLFTLDSAGNVVSTRATGLSSNIVAALATDLTTDTIYGVERPSSGSLFFKIEPTSSTVIGTTVSLDAIAFSTAAVPEPASLTLLGTGLLAAGAWRRLRRRM